MLRLVNLMVCLILLLSGCAHFSDPAQKQNKRQLQGQRQQQAQWQQQKKMLKQQLEKTTELVVYIQSLQNNINLQNTNIKHLETELNKVNESVSSVNANVQKIAIKPRVTKTIQPALANCKQSNKFIIGEKEWVYLPAANTHFKARIDSGATTSSISASNIERFEKDGQKWVRFDLTHSSDDTSVNLERPLDRRVAIIQSSSDKKESRLVISLMIKIGDISQNTQFTLADRSQMDFPILLGRSFLRDIVLIDVSKQFSQTRFIPDPIDLKPEAELEQNSETDINENQVEITQ